MGVDANRMLGKNDQRGFTIMGLLWTLLIVAFFVALVGGIVYAFYNASRVSSYEGDLRKVQAAVADYVTASSAAGDPNWPTANGKLPPPGGYAPINFFAGFEDKSGKTVRFYPQFLKDLPRHQSLWRIDSKSQVSVDIERGKY